MTDTTPNATPPGGTGGPYGPGSIPGQPQGWGAPGPHPPQGWGHTGPHPSQQGWGTPPPHPAQGWGNAQQNPESWGAGAQEEPGTFREWRSVREMWQSSPGCVNALILLVPGAIPLLLMYSLARSARRRAHQVFRLPYDSVVDTPLSRVKKTRAVLAVLASSVFLIAYGARDDFTEALTGGAIRLLVAPWLLVLTAPLLVFLLMRWASVSEHSRMRAELRTPIVTLAKYVGVLTSLPLLTLAFDPVMKALDDHTQTALLAGLTMLVLMIWSLVFTYYSSALVVRAGFGTGKVHKALPGLLTALLVWEFVPVGLLVSGMPPGPVPLALVFLLAGPLTVTAVTWWEVHRLTTRHGVVLRP